ncbi:MAG: DUF4968 domain-containing protein [Microscillaceae bacterium]|nr:DUF4968 domain-containing protein [Microscillaceae bacterium]MDW8460629.1 glycoside hydrolase family 31 protein [Cytophagales bacterium]
MKRLVFFLSLLIFIRGSLFAQNSQRLFQNYSFKDNILTLQVSDGTIYIQPYTSQIVEVKFVSKLQKAIDSSHAVILQPQKIKAKLNSTKQDISLETEGISVRVQKKPFQIQFFYKNNFLTQEREGFFTTKDSLKGVQLQLNALEALYGTGSRAMPFNRRGNRLELYNKPHYGYENDAPLMNYSLPVVLSTQKYLVFFDNATKGFVDLGKTIPNALSFEHIGGRMAYYIISGDEFYQIVQAYTELTGKQPLPPAWAFGNFASRYGYRSEKQVREVVAQFKQKQIPLSAVILDHYWYGEGEIKKSVGMGDLDWHRPNWQNGEQMVQDFNKQGIKTILITQPFVLTNSKNFAEVSEKKLLATDKQGKPFIISNFYFGETALLDIFKPQTQAWFWGKYKKHTAQGVAGWWGDLGEPEMHPQEMQHVAGSADEVHNIFGHYWAKMIYEGYQKDFPNKRPFILMRAGFAGSQRFGLIPWSGDVAHSWAGFQPQPALALNMNLTGLAYMHSDLGGFAEAKANGKNDELYLRWLEYGAYQPIFRPHSQEEVPSEPIFYDEPTQTKAANIIRKRYAMFPYHYTLAYHNSVMGCPMMRPLFWEEPQNQELWFIGDTYLWGEDLLIAPVLQPQQKIRKVYLPKTALWYDFNRPDLPAFQGGRWYDCNVENAPMPVFVRQGAFLVEITKDIEKFNTKALQISYFLDKSFNNNERFVYFDDGETPLNSTSGGEKLNFKAEKKLDKVTLLFTQEILNKGYASMPEVREIKLVIYGMSNKPKNFRINGKKLKENTIRWQNQSVEVNFQWKKGEKIKVEWQ